MSIELANWNGESLSDFKLEEWFLFKDDCFDGVSSEILYDIGDQGIKENYYWLDDFPLFEEIQPLVESEIQCKFIDSDLKYDQKELTQNEQNIIPEIQNSYSTEDLLSSSIEGATIVFSDNMLYIKSNPEVPLAAVNKENVENCQGKVIATPESMKNGEANFLSLLENSEINEIIRDTGKEIDHWESESLLSEPSSDGVTSRSNGTPEEDSDDHEWKPTRKKHPSSKKAGQKNFSLEDKRLRKKEQNKFAATRYRLKKKAEIYEIIKEEEELQMKKAKLEEKVSDIQNEIKCLKGLMRDLFKAKGLIQ